MHLAIDRQQHPDDFILQVRAALAARQRIPMAPGPVPAAVLLPLFVKDDQYHLLFTKRTEHLQHHSGEISFPGGASHADDRTLLETALRETHEEVGIAPEHVEVLGMLDDFYSIHNYLVTPYVGVFPSGYQLRPNSEEIATIIEVPLNHFRNREIFRIEDWRWQGRQHPVYFYTFGEFEIWGLTAAILKQFLDLIWARG